MMGVLKLIMEQISGFRDPLKIKTINLLISNILIYPKYLLEISKCEYLLIKVKKVAFIYNLNHPVKVCQ